MNFEQGGLYWSPKHGFVTCVQKVDDIAKFERLEVEGGTRVKCVALDGDIDFFVVKRSQMNNAVDKAQLQQDYYEQRAREVRAYIESLMYGAWANVVEDEDTKEEM